MKYKSKRVRAARTAYPSDLTRAHRRRVQKRKVHSDSHQRRLDLAALLERELSPLNYSEDAEMKSKFRAAILQIWKLSKAECSDESCQKAHERQIIANL